MTALKEVFVGIDDHFLNQTVLRGRHAKRPFLAVGFRDVCGSAAIRSASASARRDFPTPGSAEISTTRPLRALACPGVPQGSGSHRPLSAGGNHPTRWARL
jgi:hypothetical protein